MNAAQRRFSQNADIPYGLNKFFFNTLLLISQIFVDTLCSVLKGKYLSDGDYLENISILNVVILIHSCSLFNPNNDDIFF